MSKVFYTKSGIKGITGNTGPSIKEVEYTGRDGKKYTGLEFEGYASTPVLDKGGDIVLEGAFEDYLEEYKSIGAPMLLQHDDNTPVGNYTELKTDKNGLFVKGLVKMDVKNLFKALKTGVICGLSIGYSILDGAYEEIEEGVTAFVIKKLRLHEISLVSIGMNQTSLIKGFGDNKFKDLSENEIKKQFKFNSNMTYSIDKSIKGAIDNFIEENNIINPNDKKMDKKDNNKVVEEKEIEKVEKGLSSENSLNSVIKESIESKLGITDESNERVWIVEIYPDQVVYNQYNLEDYNDKYYSITYTYTNGEVTLGEPTEVEQTTEWIEKTKSFKEELKTKSMEKESKEVETPNVEESTENSEIETKQDAEIDNGEVEGESETKEEVEVETENVETETETKVEEKSAEAMEKLTKSFDDLKKSHSDEIESIKKAYKDELATYTKKFEDVDSTIKSFTELFDTLAKALAQNDEDVRNIKKGLKNAEVKKNFSVDTSKDNSTATGIDRIKAIAKENTNVSRTY